MLLADGRIFMLGKQAAAYLLDASHLGWLQQLTANAEILMVSDFSRVGVEPRSASADRVQVVSGGEAACASSQDGEADLDRRLGAQPRSTPWSDGHLRVSSADQGTDLDRQVGAASWATEHGYEIAQVATEAGSASNAKRRKFLALLAGAGAATHFGGAPGPLRKV